MGTTITIVEAITITLTFDESIDSKQSSRLARYAAARIRRSTGPVAKAIGEDLTRAIDGSRGVTVGLSASAVAESDVIASADSEPVAYQLYANNPAAREDTE